MSPPTAKPSVRLSSVQARSSPRQGVDFHGQLIAFILGNAVNGGLVGAAGPSLHAMETATGLGQSDLGRTVMYNRVAKLVGSFLWMTYACHWQ